MNARNQRNMSDENDERILQYLSDALKKITLLNGTLYKMVDEYRAHGGYHRIAACQNKTKHVLQEVNSLIKWIDDNLKIMPSESIHLEKLKENRNMLSEGRISLMKLQFNLQRI